MKRAKIALVRPFSGLLILLFLCCCGQTNAQDCDFVLNTKVVRGSSMSGLFSPGDTINVAERYYQCNPIQRHDIVLVKWAGNEVPLLKRVVGLPGDKVHLETHQHQFHLLIGGQVLQTTEGEPYLFPPNAARMFRVYIDSYRGVIPEETYIVLGNLPQGTIDSSHFGWVGRGMLVGRVM